MIINMGALEVGIKQVEKALEDYSIGERELILTHVLTRIRVNIGKAQQGGIVEDVVNKMNIKKIMQKFEGKDKEND